MAEPATHATVVGGRYHLVGGALPGGAIAQVFKAFDTKDEHGQVAVSSYRPPGPVIS